MTTTAPQPSLPDKVVAVDRALAAVPHAFGGALALAYWAEPRSTVDIDLNVFVTADRVDEVVGPLVGLGADEGTVRRQVDDDGQGRLWWGRTPIDLFFAHDPFHAAARDGAVEVPFAGTSIRVLSASHLVVCKVVFDRPRDWVDIDAVLAQGTALDAAEVLRWVGRIAGDDDPRFDRIATVLTGR